MSRSPQIAMVAGEASGDLLASELLQGLQVGWPGMSAVGIGGPYLQAQGFEAWWHSERLAVHGYNLDVFLKLAGILRIRQKLAQRLITTPPEVFIGVDAPDFNLELEAKLRRRGIKTVHFVCPSVWAWRPERIEKIRQAADRVLCIFPFEPALLERQGIQATYVGHPLARVIPMSPDKQQARVALGLPSDAQMVAILPGSRRSEIQFIAPVFLEAAAVLRRDNPHLRFVIPAVPAHWDLLQRILQESGLHDVVQLVRGHSHNVLAACDCTLIASGTATLEAALFKKPMVIAYRMGALAWQAMRRKQLQPWVGLPNILCESFVVPELIQENATPQGLADAVRQWLNASPEEHQALYMRFTTLHEALLRDTGSLAVQAIREVVYG